MALLERIVERREARRRAIVAAARRCFLRFGYDKTSLADIALEAQVARTLLYLVFKSKEELLAAVFRATYDARLAAVASIAREGRPSVERLVAAYERLLVEPWAEPAEFEASRAFMTACRRVVPALVESHDRRQRRYTQMILGSKDAAEVFALAVDGLRSDSPTAATFRRRLHTLAARFAT